MRTRAKVTIDSIARRFSVALNNGGVGGTSYFEAKCANISKTAGFTSKVVYALSTDTKIDNLG